MNSNVAKQRLAEVIKMDSITTSQADFLSTHVAVKRLYLLERYEEHPTNKKNYSEKEIFDSIISDPNNKHQFIVVQGQSGTGKSHLIRWFHAKYMQTKSPDDVVLFIRRSENTLKGTIRQLLDVPEVQGIANRDIYNRLVSASVSMNEKKLKDTIYYNLIVEIENDDGEKEISISNSLRRKLVSLLSNSLIREHLMDDDGPIERIYSKVADSRISNEDVIARFAPEDWLITPEIYDDMQQSEAEKRARTLALELMSDDSGRETAEEIANYLNQFVNDVVQHCAGIEPGDIRQIFRDIRKELYKAGKTLTLFIEDVTSFTGVDDSLLDALIVEHTGMNEGDELCRISSIVGTTDNYLHNYFRDNHKDRVTNFIYLPSDLFDHNGLYEFIARYINTISLPATVLNSWIKNKAEIADYPVHEEKEGKLWEHIDIGEGKQLSLYPFTKNSIMYLYAKSLKEGQKTPRYIIRDIIEPIVKDALYSIQDFPVEHAGVPLPPSAMTMRTKLGNISQVERLVRFLSIWGNGEITQYTEEGVFYYSGIRRDILDELGFPSFKFDEGEKPAKKVLDPAGPDNHPGNEQKQDPPITDVSPDKLERFNQVYEKLTQWVNGNPIDISTTGGSTGVLRAAVDDLCKYLESAINWLAEGVSFDNFRKIKDSSVRIVTLENTTKGGRGFYFLPATWESVNVIIAMIRWRLYGNQAWNYTDAPYDAYLLTSWTEKVKKSIVEKVSTYPDQTAVRYIEAAICAEIYSLIISGTIKETDLKKISLGTLFEKQNRGNISAHSPSWNALNKMISGLQVDIESTIRQYYNIAQGGGGTIIVLDPLEFSDTFRRLKKQRFIIAEDIMENLKNDGVKARRDVFDAYSKITERLKQVAEDELKAASVLMGIIEKDIECDDIEEDDIKEFISIAKAFYDEANNTQINIIIPKDDIDKVNKQAKNIAHAIRVLQKAVDQNSVLETLLCYAKDPMSILKPLTELLTKINRDIQKAESDVSARKLGMILANSSSDTQYPDDETIQAISDDIELVDGME